MKQVLNGAKIVRTGYVYGDKVTNVKLTKQLLDKKLTAIATEMIMDDTTYPLLIPMSKIA